MSLRAFFDNCTSCPTSHALSQHKLDYEARNCPVIKGKRLSPFAVKQHMAKDWRCEVRWGAKAPQEPTSQGTEATGEETAQ